MGNAVTEEYIRRSEALDAISRFSTENGSVLGYHSGAIDLAMEAIEAIPAVDQHRLCTAHGWKKTVCRSAQIAVKNTNGMTTVHLTVRIAEQK